MQLLLLQPCFLAHYRLFCRVVTCIHCLSHLESGRCALQTYEQKTQNKVANWNNAVYDSMFLMGIVTGNEMFAKELRFYYLQLYLDAHTGKGNGIGCGLCTAHAFVTCLPCTALQCETT